MGVGLALSEGTQLDDEGRQRNPALLDYKLVTCADAPEIEVDWIQIPAKGAGPRGSKGVGEPPQVPTAAAVANAIAKVIGYPGAAPADDPRAGLVRGPGAGLGGGGGMTRSFTSAATLEEAIVAMAAGLAARRRRHRPGRRRPSRQGAAARRDRRDRPDRGAAGARRVRRRDPSPRRARHARGDRRERDRPLAVHRARRRVGDRRLACDPRERHDRRQRDERLARDGHRRTAAVLRGHGDAPIPRGRAYGAARRALDRPRLDGRHSRGAARRDRPARLCHGYRVRVRAPGVPSPDGDRGGRRHRRGHDRPRARSSMPASRSRRSRRRSVAWPRPSAPSSGPTPETMRSSRRAGAAAAGSAPITDVRASVDYRTAMAEVVARRAIEAALARAGEGADVAIPASDALYGDLRSPPMKVDATLTVNGVSYPVEVDPHLSLLMAVREEIGLTGSKEGCDDSECGACMMLLDGRPVNSCSYPGAPGRGARDHHRRRARLATGDGLTSLQRAFLREGGVQCGFCTPGMLISATALLRANPAPSERRDPSLARGQPLPVHGLRRHRPGGAQRRRRAGSGLALLP